MFGMAMFTIVRSSKVMKKPRDPVSNTAQGLACHLRIEHFLSSPRMRSGAEFERSQPAVSPGTDRVACSRSVRSDDTLSGPAGATHRHAMMCRLPPMTAQLVVKSSVVDILDRQLIH